MTIKAALLDEAGIYERIDELASAADLTPLHLPQITRCDLPPGRYRWIPTDNPANEYGGAFWDVEVIKRLSPDMRAQLEHA